MASKKEIKKRIKGEYKKLQEDIMHYLKSNHAENTEGVYELLENTKISYNEFVKSINNEATKTKETIKAVVDKVVEDIDKNYNALKDFISKS